MLVYFAIFSAVAICVGGLIAKFYELRLDVLHGPYVGQERVPRKVDG